MISLKALLQHTLTQVIYSNVKEIVEQQQYIFDIIWSKGIPAKRRIKEIEEGIKREFIDTIQDPVEIEKATFQLLRSATEEILILFSTADRFREHQKYSEMLNLLKNASGHDVKIRILADAEDPVNKTVQNLKEEQKIKVQHYSRTGQTKITIIVVDEAYCLTIEMRDSSARTFDDAIGLATYSNSESTISSYVSIFENLWVQSVFFDQYL
jgi:two-component system, OmpR family, sensor histidine kinase VicK